MKNEQINNPRVNLKDVLQTQYYHKYIATQGGGEKTNPGE